MQQRPALNYGTQTIGSPCFFPSHFNHRSEALLGQLFKAQAQNSDPHPHGLQTQRAARGHRQERRRSVDERFPYEAALRHAARHQSREKSQPRAVELTQPRQFGSQHADLSALRPRRKRETTTVMTGQELTSGGEFFFG
jgi:hypothetical protein